MSARGETWDAAYRILQGILTVDFLYHALAAGFVLAFGAAVASRVAAGRLAETSRVAVYAARVRASFGAIVTMIALNVVVGLETRYDLAWTAFTGWDYTHWIAAVDGNATRTVQSLHYTAVGPVLDKVLTLAYTMGAFAIYFYPFFGLVVTGRSASATILARSIAVVWSIGIVFYLLFPVYEVWYVPGTGVKNILFEQVPEMDATGTYLRSINNNFPSLHTGVAVAILGALYYAREKWLAIAVAPVTAGIVFATVYLGIHWVVDVIAGLAAGWGSAWFAYRYLPPASPEDDHPVTALK